MTVLALVLVPGCVGENTSLTVIPLQTTLSIVTVGGESGDGRMRIIIEGRNSSQVARGDTLHVQFGGLAELRLIAVEADVRYFGSFASLDCRFRETVSNRTTTGAFSGWLGPTEAVRWIGIPPCNHHLQIGPLRLENERPADKPLESGDVTASASAPGTRLPSGSSP